MKENHIPGALPVGCSERDMTRAQIARVLPCVAQMSAEHLGRLGLNPAAVQAVANAASDAAGAQPTMHGVSTGVSLAGMRVVAEKPLELFYDILAPLDAFSTTFSQNYVLSGRPGVLPKLEIPVYDDQGGAQIDNYAPFSTRTDTGTVEGVEVELHKVDKVIRIYARDIEQGVDIEERMKAAASAIARETLAYVFGGMAIGTAQFNDTQKKITALEIPAIGNADGQFNFGYCNQTLTEAIQPRVHSLLVDSAHYGALKAANRDSLTAADIDVDSVHKVRDTAKFGTDAVGVITNKRGYAVGLAACYMMQGAYASYAQLNHNGAPSTLAVATWFDPDNNCICIWMGTYVGTKVVDVDAIKPLIPAAAADDES